MDRERENRPETEETEYSIFGQSMSREEIRQQKREEKEKQRQLLRQQRAQKKAARSAAGTGKKTDLIVFAAIVAVVVAVAGTVLAFQLRAEKADTKYEQDETRPSYFADAEAEPELAEDGLSAVLNALYYTKGGHLCVEMTLGNGMTETHHPESLEVKIYNGNTEKLIASGYTDQIDKSYAVVAGGTNTYTFFISPEFVKIPDDLLQLINYTVKIESSPVE